MPDVRALELLIKAANQFRFYESQHRAKTDAKDLSDVLVEETVAKADVNAAFAHEIEVFLRDVTPAQVVRSPDAYGAMVTKLQKPGEAILAQMTPLKIMCLHMAGAAASEAGELFDAIKRWGLFNKPIDRANVVEELGDLEFFMEGLRQNLDISRQETLDANMVKLGQRYEDFVFSDAATIARADKAPPPVQPTKGMPVGFHEDERAADAELALIANQTVENKIADMTPEEDR